MKKLRTAALWVLAVATLAGASGAVHLKALAALDHAHRISAEGTPAKPITMGIRN